MASEMAASMFSTTMMAPKSRQLCLAMSARDKAAICVLTASATASASCGESVTRTAEARGSCSAWLRRSAACKIRVGGVVGNNEDFAGPGDHIDAHRTGHHLFGQGDKDISGTDNDIDLGGWSACRRPGPQWPRHCPLYRRHPPRLCWPPPEDGAPRSRPPWVALP